MPRTKQNHPKNLKDKIEEAQKELKDPKASQKGVNEGGSRCSEGIKGLKRKKVVAENQLKKIPKSPVKKPSQTKTSIPHTPSTLAKAASSSSTFSRDQTQSSSTSDQLQDPEDDLVPSPGTVTVEVKVSPTEPSSLDCTNSESQTAAPALLFKGSWSANTDKEGTPHTNAPLEVLLKAMEPDFNTLTERNGCDPVGNATKSGSVRAAQSEVVVAMPAINFGLQTQPALMQPYNAAKQQFYAGAPQTVKACPQAPLQPNSQQLLTMACSRQHEKPGLQKSYSAGPSATLTRAPVPSGSSALPQSQPPVVQTCQSLSATVPNSIQVPVTPGYNPVQMATVVNFGLDQMSGVAAKDKPKKQGKYVCEYCNRACAKPSVLLKHLRSHTGERPYPCVTCGFSFKTKSNLYKHKKSHAHAIKLGLVRSESGTVSLSQESDKSLGTHSDVEESGESDEEGSTVDLDPDSSQSSVTALSESSLISSSTTQGSQGEVEHSVMFETLKPMLSQKAYEPKVTAALPKVVVYPVNVSPLRADSPRGSESASEQAMAQRQREFQPANLRSSITVLSSLKEVDCSSPLQDSISEDEEQQCKSPPGGGHAQLQRQQATDYSQQPQGKCLLSPRSLGSTDSGYFSRSESADQAMSPSSPFVKITPPTDSDLTKTQIVHPSPVVATVMHVAPEEKPQTVQGQMRPPSETRALSLEERISKLISDNEAVVDDKQLDSVKPRRTSLSRRGSIDSPKSYIFKDSFQFDLKPIGRRSSSSSDIPKSPFTPTEKSKPVFLLSVPPQYPPIECLPITRSNSMPTTPGHSALFPNVIPHPHPLRICQSFDEKINPHNDDVFSSAPSTPNPAVHSRTLVRQIAVEDLTTNEGHCLPSVRSMDEGLHGPNISSEMMQRSKSFEHGPERNRKPQQNKGTMYECETCRNRYRKLENFEKHKKFFCSELHGPKNKPVLVRESETEVFVRGLQQPPVSRVAVAPGIGEQSSMIRKRRKMKSVGDDDDQSPTETTPPCSRSFDSCQIPTAVLSGPFSQLTQSSNSATKVNQIQLIARGTESSESRLSPIRETQISSPTKDRGELQRQGSGTSVIRHTNSLSRPNSFETSESIDQSSPVDTVEKDITSIAKTNVEATSNSTIQNYHEKMTTSKCSGQDTFGVGHRGEQTTAARSQNSTPVHQSRLVRQNNIQVPEILVTEEPDREHESQPSESVDKPLDTFNWPQRSESLSKLPAEKLPPKKKRIRLAQMEHSSGESSFESSLSHSLSRDSSLSRCSSISASFDRDELSSADSPSRVENIGKPSEVHVPSMACNTLGVPGVMRRAASEQITCTQPSVEISCDYRSKSFDCSNMSPNRSLSPTETTLPKSTQPPAQVPLIERRRGPLVRQMSLKIGPETQPIIGKQTVSLQRAPSANVFSVSQQRSLNVNKTSLVQPFVLHSGEAPLQKNEHMVQCINLGSQTQHTQIYGLPHPWHQTSRVATCQKSQPLVHVVATQAGAQNCTDTQVKRDFVPKYQLQCPLLKNGQTFSISSVSGAQMTLPVIAIPIGSETVSKSIDGVPNTYVAQSSLKRIPNKAPSVLPVGAQVDATTQISAGPPPLPQILITHEHTYPLSTVACKANLSTMRVINSDIKPGTDIPIERPQVSVGIQMKSGTMSNNQKPSTESQSTRSLGSLHCTQKVASVNLSPQQEPTASSKRMLSPANSLDIAMEKQQKRAKDEHGAACLTDGRSLNYLNSKMAEVTRQRKLMLVRQVCTTEPVDSPIDTDAPVQLPDQAESEKGPQTPDPQTAFSEITDQELGSKASSAIAQPIPASVMRTTPGAQVCSGPGTSILKPQEKSEEQRYSPVKSPIRPASFQGHAKLASSVSVVNTRDSHRLSFPSLKTATTFTWCYLMKRKALHTPQTDQRISAYSTWPVNPNNPNPLGLPTKVVMSLFDSKQVSKKILYTQAITTSLKSDILAYSGKLKDILPKILAQQKSGPNDNSVKGKPEAQPSNESDKETASSKAEPRRVKIFDGGYKSNEEYVYVRGRGRGKYICEECGIRCKKPSMLRKHIRTHSDVRPYHCTHCNFSFKTKGNLTKHMKSKAHSKKCMEMGVSVGVFEDQDTEDSGDRGRASADRPDSDGDDSDGPDDEDNDGEEEDEEDSQAESGLSATPSVSASPQHLPSSQLDLAPSSQLAQMSLSPVPFHPVVPASEPLPPDSPESVAMMSPVSLVRQMSITASCSSPGPIPFTGPLASDYPASDTESVHMMSPVSPCRQMSIEYPDFEVPPSPPTPGKGTKQSQGQDALRSTSSQPSSEPTSSAVDRGTQTSSYTLQSPLHFPTRGTILDPGVGAPTHLFSHLPLHSQQPSRSPYSMVPVGGIQLVPAAGLAAYSTFVPIQAGPVQLTIPAVSVIHRNSSPLPASTTPTQPAGSPSTQPLVVQEPISGVLPLSCYPLGQVSGLQVPGLQALGASPQTLQSVGLEAISVVGLANPQLVPQQSLALNATLGVQVRASTTPPAPAHIPGLQILNISLPTLIPSLSPLSALSPLPPVTDKPRSPEGVGTSSGPPTGSPHAPASAPSPPPTALVGPTLTSSSTEVTCRGDLELVRPRHEEVRPNADSVEKPSSQPWPHQPSSSSSTSASAKRGIEASYRVSVGGVSEQKQPRQPVARQPVTDDYNEASSDDEDRLVIAT